MAAQRPVHNWDPKVWLPPASQSPSSGCQSGQSRTAPRPRCTPLPPLSPSAGHATSASAPVLGCCRGLQTSTPSNLKASMAAGRWLGQVLLLSCALMRAEARQGAAYSARLSTLKPVGRCPSQLSTMAATPEQGKRRGQRSKVSAGGVPPCRRLAGTHLPGALCRQLPGRSLRRSLPQSQR